jgi:putative peptidoglycan lipid II flippase
MFIVGLFSLIAKAMAAAKEMAVAWRFGLGSEVDAYLFLFNLLNWPIGVWFSVLTVIVIPLEAHHRRSDPDRLVHFRSELLGFAALAGTCLVAAALIGVPHVLSSNWLGLPEATAAAARKMLPVMAGLMIPGLLIGVYSTWMMGSGRYANTLYEGIPALAILVSLSLFGGQSALVWGTTIGFAVQLALLAMPANSSKELASLRFGFSSAAWVTFWRGFSIVVLSQALMSLTSLVDQFYAAHLPAGAISSIGYASRILALANGLVATAVTRATLPVFSAGTPHDNTATTHIAWRWSLLLAGVGCGGVAIGWIASPSIVHLLFERGTFTAGNTATVAHVLRLGLIQLPFYFSSLVFVSLHSSRRRYRVILASSALGLTTKFITVSVLMNRYGIDALMISSAVMYAMNALLLAILSKTRSPS